MHVVIVYESLFGNTREVAEAIGDGILDAQPDARISCVRATEPELGLALGADLLIVGGPTHNRGLTTAVTRKMGVKAEERVPLGVPGHGIEPGAHGPGVREWFQALPKAPAGSLGAAFDTRVASRMAGGAAHGISRRRPPPRIPARSRASRVHRRGRGRPYPGRRAGPGPGLGRQPPPLTPDRPLRWRQASSRRPHSDPSQRSALQL